MPILTEAQVRSRKRALWGAWGLLALLTLPVPVLLGLFLARPPFSWPLPWPGQPRDTASIYGRPYRRLAGYEDPWPLGVGTASDRSRIGITHHFWTLYSDPRGYCVGFHWQD